MERFSEAVMPKTAASADAQNKTQEGVQTPVPSRAPVNMNLFFCINHFVRSHQDGFIYMLFDLEKNIKLIKLIYVFNILIFLSKKTLDFQGFLPLNLRDFYL